MIREVGTVLQTPGALAPHVQSTFGVGKSEIVNEIAEQLGLGPMVGINCRTLTPEELATKPGIVETVIGSTIDPTEIGGIPWPKDGHLVREMPDWGRRLVEAGKGVLFFDEATCTPPAVQGPLLRVVLDRYLCGQKLPDSIHIVLASNPTEEAAGGYDLALPMWNRLVNIAWSGPTLNDWLDYDATGVCPSVPVIPRDDWDTAYPMAQGLVHGFLRAKPSNFMGKMPAGGGGCARPRTNTAAKRLIASCLVLKNQMTDKSNEDGSTSKVNRHPDAEDLLYRLLSGTVGEGWAKEFGVYFRESDLPDPESVLLNPTGWKMDPRRPDRTLAILTSVATAAVRKIEHAKDRQLAAWAAMDHAMGQGKELIVIACRTLARKENRAEGVLLDPTVKRVLVSMDYVLKNCGIAQ